MKPKFIRPKIKTVIQENQKGGGLEMITGKAMNKMFKQDKFRIGCFFMMTGDVEQKEDMAQSEEMKELLAEFCDVFAEPTELPPARAVEHKIVLKEGVQPFKMQPYRYPYLQRKEVEKMTHEMMRSGIIQTSQSSFASPVLLVKKKDGT